jgi:hypothetical protein
MLLMAVGDFFLLLGDSLTYGYLFKCGVLPYNSISMDFSREMQAL